MATSDEGGMVSRDEYARVIESFFAEMAGAGVMSYSEAALRRLPGFAGELDEHLRLVRDPATRPDQVVQMAFGLVDEFMRATWDRTITDSYQLYRDLAAEGTNADGTAAPTE